jgi:hypothetical protein
MHSELVDDLAKPIPPGRRNTTLFAIGSKMFLAQIPNWDALVAKRADEVGLDSDETDKLLANIKRYGSN